MSRGARARQPRLAYRVVGAAAGLAVIGGAGLALYAHQAPHTVRTAAEDCGLVRCSANLPAATPASPAADGTPGATRKPRAAGKRVTASASAAATLHARARSRTTAPASPTQAPPPRRPSPSPSVAPPSVAPPGPPPGPPVTVAYTVDRVANDWGGTRFVAHFTLINHTGSPVTGWTLQARLPRDRVRWVSTSGRGWPSYPDWSPARDGVVITGPQPSEAIPAHASAVLYLSAYGSTSSLASCTFNGASC